MTDIIKIILYFFLTILLALVQSPIFNLLFIGLILALIFRKTDLALILSLLGGGISDIFSPFIFGRTILLFLVSFIFLILIRKHLDFTSPLGIIFFSFSGFLFYYLILTILSLPVTKIYFLNLLLNVLIGTFIIVFANKIYTKNFKNL